MLEIRCALVVVETDRGYDAPGNVFRCMRRGALIVLGDSLLKIFSEADVTLIGVTDALEEIDVFHPPSSFSLRSSDYGGRAQDFRIPSRSDLTYVAGPSFVPPSLRPPSLRYGGLRYGELRRAPAFANGESWWRGRYWGRTFRRELGGSKKK